MTASGHDGRMSALIDALAGQRVFVEVPEGGVTDWIAVCEVMAQEGIAAWAFPAGSAELGDALAIFGRRARVGVRGARTPRQVEDAFAAGAHFVTSPIWQPDLVAAAGGRPLLPGGLTPTEVEAASVAVGTAQVIPADAMGMSYARWLCELMAATPPVATGKLERFQAEMWLEAGAPAVGLAGSILGRETGPDARSNDPDEVRRRCQTYQDLNKF